MYNLYILYTMYIMYKNYYILFIFIQLRLFQQILIRKGLSSCKVYFLLKMTHHLRNNEQKINLSQIFYDISWVI